MFHVIGPMMLVAAVCGGEVIFTCKIPVHDPLFIRSLSFLARLFLAAMDPDLIVDLPLSFLNQANSFSLAFWILCSTCVGRRLKWSKNTPP